MANAFKLRTNAKKQEPIEQYQELLSAYRSKVKALGEAEQQARLVTVEGGWERKMFEQKIAHLQEVIEAQKKKLQTLRNELAAAQKQVNEVAKKAIEGASLTKAFQSVNEIALEQARRAEGQAAE